MRQQRWQPTGHSGRVACCRQNRYGRICRRLNAIEAYAVNNTQPPHRCAIRSRWREGCDERQRGGINSAIHAQAGTNGTRALRARPTPTTPPPWTARPKCEAIVNAYQVILDNAQAADTTAAADITNATQAQYATLGVREWHASGARLLGA
jgi:hypothetical protein